MEIHSLNILADVATKELAGRSQKGLAPWSEELRSNEPSWLISNGLNSEPSAAIILSMQHEEHGSVPPWRKGVTAVAKDRVVVFTCRARGFGDAHNAETAFMSLQVPQGLDIRRYHGVDLMCSHIKCREKGTRFRFCAFCQ
jgi:hypothetical protein